MRNVVLFFFCFILLVSVFSCGKSYRNIDPTQFNNKIKLNAVIKTPKELISVYDSLLAANGEITFTQENNNFRIEATMDIHDDDELAGEKVVLFAENKSHLWKVSEIRYSMKFQEGYGHTDWGTERYESYF